MVSRSGISTSPSKVETISKFLQPTTLFHVRSFLGLASYYRCFIKDYASIARPPTEILKGDNGKVSAARSRKIPFSLDENLHLAFEKLKTNLVSEDVLLLYLDYQRPFDLTTDASSTGLGAVLSEEVKPITVISRTLKDPELHFATNERELLPILWALKRNYLYGVSNLNIYTDHQPLTFAVSDKTLMLRLRDGRHSLMSIVLTSFINLGKKIMSLMLYPGRTFMLSKTMFHLT